MAKNKVAPPFKRAEFDIMFGEGISRPGEILDLGVELDIIKKSGAWFSYDGTKLANGRDAAKKVIADNPELAAELEAKIMDALRAGALDGKPAKSTKKSSAPAASSSRKEGMTEIIDVEDPDFDIDDLPDEPDEDDEFVIEED